ncbi:MAG: hypothetical protein QNJ65_10235 [Xenococcaceae cyanobacterium MO_234.B1]|nr:hypothetical protein [Xenococcaceae cyanobacterium MO_234.B1]
MVISTPQKNLQPPQAPSTPVVAQQALTDLVNYYRELADFHRSSIDYHQKLLEQHSAEAEAAEKQLASIEALLNPLTTESVNQEFSSNVNGKLVNETVIITPLEDKSEVTTSEPKPEKQVEKTTTDAEKSESEDSKSITGGSPKNNRKTKSTATKAAKTKSTGNRVAKTKSTATRVAKTKKPTQKKKTNKAKKSTKAPSSRLPYSEKLASHETVVNAVAFCLQEYYPKVITAEDVVKYYYPDGLEGDTKKRAYAAFSDCLIKGAGKRGWVKVSIGKYSWQDEGL